MTEKEVRALLAHGLAPHWYKLEVKLIEDLANTFMRWNAAQETLRNESDQHVRLAHFLIAQVNDVLQQILRLKLDYGEFTKRFSRALLPEDKQAHILDYAATLGADKAKLRGDRKAFNRWFGSDAMTDRYLNRIAKTERFLSFCLQRLGVISGLALQNANNAESQWQQFELEELLAPLLTYEGDQRVRIEAFRCLATALQKMPTSIQSQSINDHTLQYVLRAATDARLQVWIQCEALNLLATLSMAAFTAAVTKRIERPRHGDDIFVRHRAISLVSKYQQQHASLIPLLEVALRDPSPYVRQAVAEALAKSEDATIIQNFPLLLLEDDTQQVRAAAALQIPAMLEREPLFESICTWLADMLIRETDAFALKIALMVSTQCMLQTALSEHPDRLQKWSNYFTPLVEAIHLNTHSLAIRRFAAMTREWLWCLTDPRRKQLMETLQNLAQACQPGKSIRIPHKLLHGWNEADVGRILAIISQKDFGLSLEKTWTGWHLWRGHIFSTRLWRVLHEFRHPSPDKRQAFSHTIGRVFYGRRRAASAILAELAETKVPGEPLQHASEGGWRPYLPLVDEFISALDQTLQVKPVIIHCAEGMTEITPPASIIRRISASLKLTWNFERYARQRNWHEGSQQSPDAYLKSISDLGFTIKFHAHGKQPEVNVQRFFPAGFVLAGQEFDWWPRLHNYFFSVFENTLPELAMFTAFAIVAFITRHLYLNWLMHRARAGIPLVVGGWGTRGKSGTERIKAALFNALGYSIISKTTGCEAMFLHGPAYGQLREMFLFRPYDKATIWEQHNVVRLAQKLGGDIFLWECMALTPSFVQLLQRRWMQDDFSTITNTFPDHEDLQGPAGINIPEVMTNFIPEKGHLITSEEQMRPILSVAAKQLDTPLRGVGWVESGLLAPELLARFPYQEHPDNIALVLALADEMGIPQDFAIKEMADRVVPDLGVLKVYPAAPVNTRLLEFVNGMSANERFGCLGNWNRTGFATHNMEAEPGVMLTAVVNNRADRIARSRVFAGILVEDISTDLIVLIGSNLHGLQGYIRESWEPYAASLSLWPSDGDSPEIIFERMATRMRIVHKDTQAQGRLRAMLNGCGLAEAEAIIELWTSAEELANTIRKSGIAQAEQIIAFTEHDRTSIKEYAELKQKIVTVQTSASHDTKLDSELRELLWRWLQRRILVVEDYHASGNQIIHLISQVTPPGFKNRIHGIQNIKGTGLDFVYRWQAWDTCYKACSLLQSDDPDLARQGLAALASFQEFGLLCAEHVHTVIGKVKVSSSAQNERFQSELTIIASRLDLAMQDVMSQMSATRSTGRLEKVLSAMEAFFDAGDAVKRRKLSNVIYEDLVSERISHARAALELQSLNQRQKGGWLMDRLLRWSKKM